MDIIEVKEISSILKHGTTVICAGGGGIPVVREVDGELRGVDAVVDKDLTTALLAVLLKADRLLLLTDVANVERDYGTSRAHAIGQTTVGALRELDFAAGSMGPKVEAACRFAERTGGTAAIGKAGRRLPASCRLRREPSSMRITRRPGLPLPPPIRPRRLRHGGVRNHI